MDVHALETANLVQVCLQIAVLWILIWLLRLARDSHIPNRILAIEVISLLVLATAPVLLLVIALVAFHRQSHTFWLGLGCSVVTFESSAAMVFSTIYCDVQVFKPEILKKFDQHFCLACMSGLGLTVLILAVAAAALDQSEFGFFAAGLGGSFIQLTCSWRVDGRRGKVLQLFVLTALTVEILMCFLVGGVRNKVIGFDKASKCVWALSQVGIWGQFLIIDCNCKARACLCGPWRESSSWSNLDPDLPSTAVNVLHPPTANPPEAPTPLNFPLQAIPQGQNTRETSTDVPGERAGIHAWGNYFGPQPTYSRYLAPTSPHSHGFQSSSFSAVNSSNAGFMGIIEDS